MTEERVAKVLAKAGKGPGKSRAKDGPTHEYDYNGFHCKLVGNEVILGGRNYSRTKQSVKQFVADYQQALESFPGMSMRPSSGLQFIAPSFSVNLKYH